MYYLVVWSEEIFITLFRNEGTWYRKLLEYLKIKKATLFPALPIFEPTIPYGDCYRKPTQIIKGNQDWFPFSRWV
jgi:hypothetical protein